MKKIIAPFVSLTSTLLFYDFNFLDSLSTDQRPVHTAELLSQFHDNTPCITDYLLKTLFRSQSKLLPGFFYVAPHTFLEKHCPSEFSFQPSFSSNYSLEFCILPLPALCFLIKHSPLSSKFYFVTDSIVKRFLYEDLFLDYLNALFPSSFDASAPLFNSTCFFGLSSQAKDLSSSKALLFLSERISLFSFSDKELPLSDLLYHACSLNEPTLVRSLLLKKADVTAEITYDRKTYSIRDYAFQYSPVCFYEIDSFFSYTFGFLPYLRYIRSKPAPYTPPPSIIPTQKIESERLRQLLSKLHSDLSLSTPTILYSKSTESFTLSIQHPLILTHQELLTSFILSLSPNSEIRFDSTSVTFSLNTLAFHDLMTRSTASLKFFIKDESKLSEILSQYQSRRSSATSSSCRSNNTASNACDSSTTLDSIPTPRATPRIGKTPSFSSLHKSSSPIITIRTTPVPSHVTSKISSIKSTLETYGLSDLPQVFTAIENGQASSTGKLTYNGFPVFHCSTGVKGKSVSSKLTLLFIGYDPRTAPYFLDHFQFVGFGYHLDSTSGVNRYKVYLITDSGFIERILTVRNRNWSLSGDVPHFSTT